MRQKLIDHLTNINASYGTTPPMPIESQVDYLLKKYEIMTYDISYPQTNGDGESIDPIIKNKVLIKFKDVIVKYRPHLHMGDYWLDIEIQGAGDSAVAQFKFYNLVEFKEETLLTKAFHPHLQGGVPCFGSFQGDIHTVIKECNFITFMSQMKLYLSSYYGRSVYRRGSEWKKRNCCWALYSHQDIYDIFAPESKDPGNMDIHEIAIDPTRWNHPKDMPARGTFELQGQDVTVVNSYLSGKGGRYMSIFDHNFPFFSEHAHIQRYDSWSNEHVSKLWGYVHICMEIGEMSIMHALEFTRIFLYKLFLEYTDEFDEEAQNKLEEMSRKLANTFGNTWKVNNRYQIPFNNTDDIPWRDRLNDLRHKADQVGNMSSITRTFMEEVKFAGHKLGQFIVLIRKGAPDKARMSTFMWKQDKLKCDYSEYLNEYDILEKHAYKSALTELEKEKRRFINAINRSQANNTVEDGGQGTLFS